MRIIKKPKLTVGKYVILQDDREKMPWSFLRFAFTIKKKRLKVGDYTFEGFEDLVAIEKKSGLEELLSDLTAGYRPTFERFLKKLSKVPIRIIIVEDNLSNLSKAIYILRRKTKSQLTENTICYWLAKIVMQYKIPVLFVGPKSMNQETAILRMFEMALEQAIMEKQR